MTVIKLEVVAAGRLAGGSALLGTDYGVCLEICLREEETTR